MDTFTRRPAPDAAALVARGTTLAVYRWQAEVVLHLRPHDAAQLVPPTVGILEPCADEHDDSGAWTLLRIGGHDLACLGRVLVGLGCGFHVLTPPSCATNSAPRRAPATRPPDGCRQSQSNAQLTPSSTIQIVSASRTRSQRRFTRTACCPRR
jgi:hypothetical protein